MAEFRHDSVEIWGSRYQDGVSAYETSGAIADTATTVLWSPASGYGIRIQKIIVCSLGATGTVVKLWLNAATAAADLSAVEPDFVVDTNGSTNVQFDVDILGTDDYCLHYSCPDKTFILVYGREET